jgi:hypothetical protein
MALDRFVHWHDLRNRPTRAEVRQVITNYLGGVGQIRWRDDQDRFYIELPGKPTHPLVGIDPLVKMYEQPDRWIEVYVSFGEPMDIITRDMDPFTNAIAADLANIFIRQWSGRVELGVPS